MDFDFVEVVQAKSSRDDEFSPSTSAWFPRNKAY
jgi:hypothetical protein